MEKGRTMAAVTVNKVTQWANGNRVQIVADIDIANNGDTWDTTLSDILGFWATPKQSSLSQVGYSAISNGTITFATGGAESNVLVSVIGDGM